MPTSPKTVVIIQARMGSTRLPGKIAKPIGGMPLLGRTIRRLQAAGELVSGGMKVMVATSTAPQDDATERLCREFGVDCFHGSELDVLARYVAASADLDERDTVCRATADNGVYCPVHCAKIVMEHRQREADYTCIEPLSYVVTEVMQVSALREMARRATSPYCREHVTPYFRQHPEEFKVVRLPPTWEGLRPDILLTLDTPEDFKKITWLYQCMAGKEDTFTLDDVYKLWDSNPPFLRDCKK